VRFGNLTRKGRDASKKVFTETLRQLEAQGLVTRHVMEAASVSVQDAISSYSNMALDILDGLRRCGESLSNDGNRVNKTPVRQKRMA